MLTDEQKKELDKDIEGLVDKRVEERLAKEIVKRFSPGEPEIKVTKDAGDQPWESLGQQLMAVKDFALTSGLKADARLKAPQALSEGQASEGGFLVHTDFSTQLLEKAYADEDILARVTRIPISANSNSLKMPAVSETSRADGSRWGGIRAYWASESGTKTQSQPAFDQISLELKKLVAITYATDELLEDASALEAWIRLAFGKEMSFKIVNAIVRGDGSGKPLGVINAPCLVSQAAETGQSAATILAENIIKMWARMYAPCRSNAVWLISQNIEPQLYTMSLAVGTGGIPVYMPAGGLSGQPYGTLMGRPVIPSEHCYTLGTVGDIILADLSQYIMIDKGGMQSASSIHVYFTTDQTAFRFTYRCDGQPWWRSALTPYNAGSTQSPFIALATRS